MILVVMLHASIAVRLPQGDGILAGPFVDLTKPAGITRMGLGISYP